MTRAWLAALLLVSATTATGDEPPPEPAPPLPPSIPVPDVGRLEAGRRLYEQACASCHGDSGDGRGPAARMLETPPRDFVAGVYKFRSTASGSLPLVEDVDRTLTEGVLGTSMPGWRSLLGKDERRWVAEYVLSFSPRWSSEPRPERIIAAADALKPPPVTRERVERGRTLYRTMGCGECHGPSGHGDGAAAGTLKDDAGRRIRPLDFTRGFYKGGSSPADLYRTLVTGISGTPMPSYGDAMPEEDDRWSLVLFTRSLSRGRGVGGYLFGRQTPWQ